LLRLKKIIEIHQAAQEEGIVATTITENCRTFFKEVATPVTNCLQNHFNNNEMAFLAVNTKMVNFYIVNLRGGALG